MENEEFQDVDLAPDMQQKIEDIDLENTIIETEEN